MGLSAFKSHLGFPNPDLPLFDALVASADPVEHIAFAAAQGFGGVFDPFSAMRDPALQARIGDAAARYGLEMGSVLYAPFDTISRARWGSEDADHRGRILADIREAIAVARRLGADCIVAISVAEASIAVSDQYRAMADLLRHAGDMVAAAGITLCVEGTNRARLPHMLLHGIEESAAVVRLADHPAVRLVFDTGHSAASGEDVDSMLARHHPLIGAIQIADHPGRTEIGVGQIDFEAFFAKVSKLGLSCGFELEHRWSEPGAARQSAYLEQLRHIPDRIF